MTPGASRDEICDRFLEAVPFDLYPFQEEALLAWFEAEGGVLISAPTGMGKTLVAEAALFEALHQGSRLYYTTPLIALTDQKFREFQDRAEEWGFSRDDVGLVTGNRKVNPLARVLVVVAEILLNRLLAREETFDSVAAVVMDEFHWFNDLERGVVWELSLVLLPRSVRLMLLSATIGNPVDFLVWLERQHGRRLKLVATGERKVPLEFHWVEDRLLTEQLEAMVAGDGDEPLVPALVFCFERDECFEVAERIKGLPLIPRENRDRIEAVLERFDLGRGIGPKLRNMLIRGVGVHHAGVLPCHKQVVEELFLDKLIPFVICTETLAAGVNLPARSVVMSTLLKGKHGAKKLIAPASAHQIFGRAGRPQFDAKGHVFALAHEDDVRIVKWKRKFDELDPGAKDLGVLKARKQLERKRPTRRKTEQFWTEGQWKTLIQAGPAPLRSRAMLPYRVLVWLLSRLESLELVRQFVASRFQDEARLAAFARQLEPMLDNLAALGVLKWSKEDSSFAFTGDVEQLMVFRSVDPLYGTFLARELARASFVEKIQALESILPAPPRIARLAGIPEDLEKGPLQTEVLEPMLTTMGIAVARPEPAATADGDDWNPWREEDERPPNFPEMLKIAFEAELAAPEEVEAQAKWLAGGVLDSGGDFYSFIKSRSLEKNEGIVFRHMLRLAILAREFLVRTEDPDYQDLEERVTAACRDVDPTYTERYLAREDEEVALD